MRNKLESPSRQSGFSAIELMLTLAIVGLTLGAAYRGVSDVMPKLQARQAVSDLAGALRAARAQAIVDRTDSLTIPIDVSGQRYVVVSHLAPGTIVRVNTTEGVRRVARLPTGLRFGTPPTVTGSAVTLTAVGGSDPAVVFDAKGQVRATTLPGYIHLAYDRDRLYWRIVVERAGNIRIQRWTGNKFE